MAADRLWAGASELKFRDPKKARSLVMALEKALEEYPGELPVWVMHVCGTHEQAIAKFGLRAILPKELNVIMGPGCPVCVTDTKEVDEGVALVAQGVRLVTYGDMLRVPGTRKSLADARTDGGKVDVVYSVAQAVALARQTDEQVVFYATGFETTAVTTAAIILSGVPDNLSILVAHKYVPAAMEAVARIPKKKIEGFLAAGHAATVTGWGLFESFAKRHQIPVVVAGFEPLDILAALVKMLQILRDGTPQVANMYPRCVTQQGNTRAMDMMWEVFRLTNGQWRGIGEIPDGNLQLRDEWAHLDTRRRFDIDTTPFEHEEPDKLAQLCRCGDLMIGMASPTDCPLFGKACRPDSPVGACMVSTEGPCRIWYEYGGYLDLGGEA